MTEENRDSGKSAGMDPAMHEIHMSDRLLMTEEKLSSVFPDSRGANMAIVPHWGPAIEQSIRSDGETGWSDMNQKLSSDGVSCAFEISVF